MKLSEFIYDLPKDLIAQFALADRSQAKLLCLERTTGKIAHHRFFEIKEFFEPGDVLVLNNTKVFKARLQCRKETGGKVEVLLIREINNGIWEAMIAHAKGIKMGTRISLGQDVYAVVKEKKDVRYQLEFNTDPEQIINNYGAVPLPPYIKRPPISRDEIDYQTIFAKKTGSIAAPTAGLHFTQKILAEIAARGVALTEITLHIGPGTFRPIRSENIEEHKMDAEYFEISSTAAEMINRGKRIFAVGTSVCRVLESIAISKKVNKGGGATDLFIYPSYKFRIIDGLITNFHLPGSTPLLLVCAFAGKELIFKTYREAIDHNYRFLSYGDAMLVSN